jgi:uncharacterized protein (DUF433 family)
MTWVATATDTGTLTYVVNGLARVSLKARMDDVNMARNLISVDPQVQGGVPVFTGTRVPVKNLFDYLEAGESLDQFLDDFPSVRRETLIAVLEQAREAVTPHAHSA